MAGLIANDITPNNTADTKTVYGAETTPYDATLRAVDPAKETVAGQLQSILSSGSPYVEQAKAGARETANSRGLLNTSMAAGAGESAAIGAALPIAQADANVYGTASQQNQAYKNSSDQFNSAAQNTSDLALAGAANTSELSSQQAADRLELQKLQGSQAETLANIEANYKALMQSSSSATALFNESQQQIATILRDPNTSAEQKASAVDAVNQLLSSGLATIGSIANLDLGSLLNFTVPTAAQLGGGAGNDTMNGAGGSGGTDNSNTLNTPTVFGAGDSGGVI